MSDSMIFQPIPTSSMIDFLSKGGFLVIPILLCSVFTVAVVETDACSADAVQVMTGCTFGKGNFFYRDYGKMALTLLSRNTGKGVESGPALKVLEHPSHSVTRSLIHPLTKENQLRRAS